MKIIGVTGSSGSGKNTVCDILEKKYNTEIIDADKIAKELSMKGTIYFNSIVNYFGSNILNKQGDLNRKKLAQIIFTDENKREELNKLTFIHVVDEIKRRIRTLTNKKIIALNAPLLYESNLNTICDYVVSVISDKEKQVERIINRDNITKEQVIKRIEAQNTNEFFIENSEYIIINNTDIKDIEEQLKKIIK